MVTAINDFNNSEVVFSSVDLNEKSSTSTPIGAIASGVNRLSIALSEYRSDTVNSAFGAIKDLDLKLQNVHLTSTVDVRSNEEKSVELNKLLIIGPFKP